MKNFYFEKISLNSLSRWHAYANNPGKKLKMGNVLWLIIPFYKLEKFSMATELCGKQSCDILFWELVYPLNSSERIHLVHHIPWQKENTDT